MPAIALPPIQLSRTINLPARDAFQLFSKGIASWWPQQNTWSKKELAAVILEPRTGGRWFERSKVGIETPFGRVLACSTPQRLLLAWQVAPNWKPDENPRRASEIEVRFIPQSPGVVRIDLQHREFHRHGSGAPAMYAALAGAQGWPHLLLSFARAANERHKHPGVAASAS